jgi:hypothetical protein
MFPCCARTLLVLAVCCTVASSAFAQTPLSEPRSAALSEIRRGDPTAAALILLDALRKWPDDVSAIDEAVPSIYLFLFTMEYLVDEPARRDFCTHVMQEDKNPVDDMLLTGLYLNLDSGLDQEEFNAVGRKLQALSVDPKPMVRAIAMMVLAAPYYYRDSIIALNNRQALVKHFPQLEITKAALRAPLYAARKKIIDEPDAVIRSVEDDGLAEARRNDPVIQGMRTAVADLKRTSQSEGAARVFAEATRSAASVEDRYANLYMLEPFAAGGKSAECKAAVLDLAMRPAETADSTYARIQMLRMAAIAQDAAELRRWADALLAQDDLGNGYSRNLFEDLVKDVSAAAEALAKAGDPQGAAARLDVLAARFPNSPVASTAKARAVQLREAK